MLFRTNFPITAICDKKTNENAACHKNAIKGQIVKPDGSSVTLSGGSCYSPERCQSCVKGFWAKRNVQEVTILGLKLTVITAPYCEGKAT
jgi:hypothetical protein